MSPGGRPQLRRSTIQRLTHGLRQGQDVSFADTAGGRTPVAAEDIRSALLTTRGETDPRPIRISGAEVRGELDLRNMVIGRPLTFEDCTFGGAIRLEGASLAALVFDRCRSIPGIIANGCTIDHDLVIQHSTVKAAVRTLASMRGTAAIWLCEARLGGRLLIRDQSVVDGLGGRSIQGDRITVSANIRILYQSEIRGELRLISAQVAGSLDIISSSVRTHDEIAVELAEARFGGSLFLARKTPNAQMTEIDGLLVLSDVRVGAFVTIRGSTLRGRKVRGDGPYDRPQRGAETVAIMASRCEVGDDLHIDGDTTVIGGLAFPHAVVQGDVLLNGLAIDNPGDRCLDFGNAQISGSLVAREAAPSGTIWLAGGQVSGSVALEGTVFTSPSGRALVLATGMRIGGDLHLREVVTVDGSLRFRSAEIGGEVSAHEAVLSNPEGETLSFSNAQIGGAVQLVKLFSDGLLTMNRATVAGRVQLTGSELVCETSGPTNVHGRALEIVSSDIEGGLYLDWARVSPSVDLFSTTTTILADEAATWPASADLSGLTYERFDEPDPTGSDPWEVTSRLKVLASQTPFDLAPYEIAARVYAEHGRLAHADQLRIAGRHRASVNTFHTAWAARTWTGRVAALVRRTGDELYRSSTGYGHRPSRALALIAVLLGLVALSLIGPWSGSHRVMRATGASGAVYSPSGPTVMTPGADDPCGGDVRCFQPMVYAIETVVPLVDLGQRNTWHVNSTARLGWLYEAWLTAATLAGWVLTTVFVLAFSRLGRTT